MQQQIKITISPFHFEEIVNKGYSIDIICLLKMVQQGIDVKTFCSSSPKLSVLHQTLMRKGVLTADYQLTLEGKSILEFIEKPTDKQYTKKKPVNDAFERWWKAYPGTDTFTHKGKTFTGSRVLRTRKEDCKAKLNNILAEGQYTIDQLIAALEQEVLQKKEKSVKDKTNKMSYMQNSLTYLNQRTFEPFIELINAKIPTTDASASIKDVDI